MLQKQPLVKQKLDEIARLNNEIAASKSQLQEDMERCRCTVNSIKEAQVTKNDVQDVERQLDELRSLLAQESKQTSAEVNRTKQLQDTLASSKAAYEHFYDDNKHKIRLYDEITTQIAKQEDENGKMKEKKAMLEQELTRLEDVQEETTK